MIPVGDVVTMPAGTVGYITQALGGSFTVFVDGNLFRVAGVNADAIGKEPVLPPSLPDPVNIVDLGLIYRCDISRDESGALAVDVEMTLTAPGCGMGDILVDDVRSKLELVPTVNTVNVELTFEPPWNHSMMSEVARLETGMF
jgi:metal-sulfur cluster biosynthetic enzyme